MANKRKYTRTATGLDAFVLAYLDLPADQRAVALAMVRGAELGLQRVGKPIPVAPEAEQKAFAEVGAALAGAV